MKPGALLFCVLGLLLAHASLASAQELQEGCAKLDKEGKCLAIRASMINLIATPERFHGKKVQVSGYLVLEFENLALSFERNSGNSEAFWADIDINPRFNKEEWTDPDLDHWYAKKHLWNCKYNRQMVTVRGLFNSGRPDVHVAVGYPGSILIEHIELRSLRQPEKPCKKQQANYLRVLEKLHLPKPYLK